MQKEKPTTDSVRTHNDQLLKALGELSRGLCADEAGFGFPFPADGFWATLSARLTAADRETH